MRFFWGIRSFCRLCGFPSVVTFSFLVLRKLRSPYLACSCGKSRKQNCSMNNWLKGKMQQNCMGKLKAGAEAEADVQYMPFILLPSSNGFGFSGRFFTDTLTSECPWGQGFSPKTYSTNEAAIGNRNMSKMHNKISRLTGCHTVHMAATV